LPTFVPNVSGAVSACAGDGHGCAALSDGTVWCWGSGALGATTSVALNGPVQAVGLTNVREVTCGLGHTCAVGIDGAAHCWGGFLQGTLPDGLLEPGRVLGP
jgi:alpha-tubulin suppressor-like RCC1 family protein